MQGHGPAPPLVAFLSDFGTADPFVGLCHAAVLAACPHARLVDLSHAVAPHDVAHGAARLADAVEWVRQPAVHLAVVDPGVGTQRRALALDCGASWLVGPDNGLLLPAAHVLGGIDRAWRLGIPEGASATFHGRDVFAPAAGRLAAGSDPAALGEEVDPGGLVRARTPEPSIGSGHVDAPVRDVDRFGNLQLSLRPADLARAGLDDATALAVRAPGGTTPAQRVRTFGDLPAGALGIMEDSFGWVAVVLAGDSAADRLGVGLHGRLLVESDLPGDSEGA